MLEDANRSIAEYKVMTCAEAQDLHDILAAFESIFKVCTYETFFAMASANLTSNM